jgi:hypothetical protein
LLNVKQKMQYHADFTTFLYSQRTMHRPNRKTLSKNSFCLSCLVPALPD